MLEYIIVVVLIALSASWLIDLSYKLKYKGQRIIEIMQMYALCDKIHEMLNCDFCYSFWTAMLLSIVASVLFGNWWFMLAPIFTTNITKNII